MHRKISMKTDKDGFSPAMFKSRLEQKNLIIESLLLLCFVSYGEIYGKNGYLCSFLLPQILFLRIKCGEGSPWSVL